VSRPLRGSGHPGQPVDRNPGAAERIPPDPRAESPRLRRSARLWGAAWTLARRVPEPVAFAAADLGGRLAHRRGGAARQRLRANLSRVVPPEELEEATEAAFRSYARYWVEAFRAADLDPADLDRRTELRDFDRLDAVLDRGRGAIVLLAHHGSWDVAARWAETHGYHLAVVAEVVRPRALFERFVRLREAMGLEVVPYRPRSGGGSQTDVFGRLAEVLAANHLVGLLADRDLSGRAPDVEFFGEPAPLPPGPALLARRTGAPIVPVTMLQRPRRRWEVVVLPPLEVAHLPLPEACAQVARALEQIIRLDPVQWHALQPVFRADRGPVRRPADEGAREAS